MIDCDVPHSEFPRECFAALRIDDPDTRAEAVGCVVRHVDGFPLVFDFGNGRDEAEQFFSSCRGVFGYVCQNCRRVVVTWSSSGSPPSRSVAPASTDAVTCSWSDSMRSALACGPTSVSGSVGPPTVSASISSRSAHRTRCRRLVDKKALRGDTGLPIVLCPCVGRPFHSLFERRIVEDNKQVTPSEFKHGRLEFAPVRLRDGSSKRVLPVRLTPRRRSSSMTPVTRSVGIRSDVNTSSEYSLED